MVFGISLFGNKSKNSYEDATNTNETSYGTQNQNQNQTQRGSVSGTQNVIAPEWWKTGTQSLYGNIDDLINQYGIGGVSPARQGAMNQIYDIANPANGAAAFLSQNVNPALQGIAGSYSPFANGPGYSLKGATPTVNAEGVTANTGYSMADPYREAYGSGVLNPALADFDEGVSRSANAFRAGGLTMSPNTRQSVAGGVLAADAARGRGGLSAQIRSDILDKSFGFGGNDAGMKLGADTFSAGARNTASSQNAQMAQADRMAQLQADISTDDRKMSALGNMAQLVQAQGDNALSGQNAASQAALNALQASGIPLQDAMALIQSMIGGLNTAVPGFGTQSQEENDSSGSTSGTTTTNTTGTTNTSSKGSGKGTSFGFSTGGSVKK